MYEEQVKERSVLSTLLYLTQIVARLELVFQSNLHSV